MARSHKYQPYYQDDYSGGLNDTNSAVEINRNEASVLRNWDITAKGRLVRRPGTTQVGGTIHNTNPITGMGGFHRNGSAKDILATVTTSLYYLNSTTWTAIKNNLTNTSGLRFWFTNVQTKGKIYFGNEDNQFSYWDRTDTTLNTCIDVLLEADVPHGNVSVWHKNHMFQLNNVNLAGTKYANRVYFSNIGDPETYTHATDFFEVPGSGAVITAIDVGNYLAIFKERSIQILSGWGSASWVLTTSSSNVENLSEQVGISGIYAATRVGDEVWFMDDEGQIRRLYRTNEDNFRTDIVCTKVQTTLSGMNRTRLDLVSSYSHDNKVHFALPMGTDTFTSTELVFDIIAAKREAEAGRKAEAWTTYTGHVPAMYIDYPTSSGAPDLIWGGSNTGKVFKRLGTDDGGVAVDARWDGKQDYFDKQSMYKRYFFGKIRGTATSGSASVGIYASVDSAAYALVGTLSLQSTGSMLGPTGSFLLGPTGNCRLGGASEAEEAYLFTNGGGSASGRSRTMSIRHATAGQQPTVGTFTDHYRDRVIRYG